MGYKVRKKIFSKNKIDHMEIFFDNGDFLSISKKEIVDFSVNLYDELVMGIDYWNSFSCVVESGNIRLKIEKKPNGIYDNPYLCDLCAYKKDRISYIKDKLCVKNDEIVCVKIYDKSNWHFTLYCRTENTIDGEYLLLKFLPCKNKSCDSNFHTISLPQVTKSIVETINLDFENCESITIKKEEIVDMNLKFSETLCWGSGDYIRVVTGGFLKIKLDKEYNYFRDCSLQDKLALGEKGNKQIERRLCGKKGFDVHDICNLYVEYDYAGSAFYRRECLEVRSIVDIYKLSDVEKLSQKDEDLSLYIGGYAQKQDDGTILITFGETSKQNEIFNQQIKKYV